MRILIAGLGSVGRRHLRNLVALGERDLVLLRSHRSTLPDDELAGFPIETDLEAALARRPEAVVIANPTALHLDVALPAARAGCHLLIEKPVSHTLEHLDDLADAQRRSGARILVGHQFRFHPLLRRLRELVASGEVGEPRWAQAHYGEYLPGWHPWEDYRTSYSARADLGGGALLTLCHAFDWLAWILGPLSCDAARVATLGALGVDVDDCADVWLSSRTGAAATVHLDYYQRPAAQWLSVAGDGGWLRCDFLGGRLEGWSRRGGDPLEDTVPAGWERNEMFRMEMVHFLRLCRGEEASACGLEEGIESLALTVEARRMAAVSTAQGGSR
jgi:predicted dehydrogenase